MGKNNKLINQMNALALKHKIENIEKAASETTPQIYAAIALALHREVGFGYERINRVFLESQRIWEGYKGNLGDMYKLCEAETGITVMNKESQG